MMMMESSRRHRAILHESGEVNGRHSKVSSYSYSYSFSPRCKFSPDTGIMCVRRGPTRTLGEVVAVSS